VREEVKTLWLDALRSGKYRQTRNTLRRGDSFCCLGVLCDVAVKSGLDLNISSTPQNGLDLDDDVFYSYDHESGTLPLRVQEWAGLDAANPTLRSIYYDDDTADFQPTELAPDPQHEDVILGHPSLAELNDIYELSFEQIAEIVEKYL